MKPCTAFVLFVICMLSCGIVWSKPLPISGSWDWDEEDGVNFYAVADDENVITYDFFLDEDGSLVITLVNEAMTKEGFYYRDVPIPLPDALVIINGKSHVFSVQSSHGNIEMWPSNPASQFRILNELMSGDLFVELPNRSIIVPRYLEHAL